MLINNMNSGFFFLQIFQILAYAPTSNSQETDVTHFENALASAISICSTDDISYHLYGC